VARRRRRGVNSLSLFPFLSVLACVIGALTLLITALAIGQLATDTVDVADFRAAEAKVQEGTAERAELQARLAWSEASSLERRRSELERERDRLRAELQSVSAELDGRSALPTEPRILLQPSGSGQRLSPRFVECRAGELRLHQGGGFGPPIPVDQLPASARYRQFLREVVGLRSGTVIFLIRPDGVRTYNAASAVAAALGVRHGKLPIPGQGEIDFSLL
jgi:hypothetical protein